MSVKPQTLQLLPLSVRAELGSANADERIVDVTWSTGATVLRRDPWTGQRYYERLSMDPKHIRLDRMNAGAPVLDTHSAWSISDVLGATVERTARVENGVGASRLQFSRRASVSDIWQDVVDKIIRFVSIGYLVFAYRDVTEKGAELKTFEAIDWEPYETSMVPMPADAGAGTRDRDKLAHPCVVLTDGRSADDADRMRRFRLALARAV